MLRAMGQAPSRPVDRHEIGSDRGAPQARSGHQAVLGRDAPQASSRDQAVLALQNAAGNAAVGKLLRQVASKDRTPTKQAVDAVRRRFSKSAIQTLQLLVGGAFANGRWDAGWADSLARFQARHQLSSPPGLPDRPTLDALVAQAVSQDMQTEVIHLVAEFFRIDTTDVISLRFDPTLGTEAVAESFGGLDSVRLGSPAMVDAAKIKSALEMVLTPSGADPGSSPLPFVRMSQRDAELAAKENNRLLRDDRAVRIIQDLLDEELTGRFSPETSRRIADFQASNNLLSSPADAGRLTYETFKAMVDKLIARHHEEPAIRLVLDWYEIEDRGPLDVAVDRALPVDFEIHSASRPGPAIVTFGAAAFAAGHESLVHTIEQAYTEARARTAGLSDSQARFLGFRARVLSQVGDVFATDPNTIASLGFVRDARLALEAFKQLPQSVQQRLKSQFEGLRNVVEGRFSTADPQEQAAHAALVADYRAVTL